ncbi:MAG: carbohydrate binding domain-containing protein [Flavobacteriales bacterium]|nr:carbohydrate binding domain-containing protein [Flavobacteriales bacterium]MCB9166712.1 carbohydrate binding domain-containing protein [Flavobacteriales bacterium]
MKRILTPFLLIAALHLDAQTIIATSFESWTGTAPDGWLGSKTTFAADSVQQADQNIQFGSYAVRLVNTTNSHKRFTNQGVPVTDGTTYSISFYARGGGEIRTGMYDGRSTGSGYATYNSYETVNSTSWAQYTQQVTCAHDTTGGEFILSVRNTVPGMGQLEVDSVRIFIGTVTPPTTATIHDIQYTTDPSGDSPLDGQAVVTTGTVTAVAPQGYFLQDGAGPWNGLYVYDLTNTPAIGDNVSVTGTISEYFNLTELGQVTDFSIASSGNAVVTTNVTTADANAEQYESQLLTVSQATCTDPNSGNGQWIVNDGSGDVFVDDLIYAFTPTLNTMYNVTGPLNYSFSEWKVEPRDANDIEVASGIASLPGSIIQVGPNPTNGPLRIMGASGTLPYVICDAMGRRVLSGTMNSASMLDLSGLKNGVYQFTLGNAVQRIVVRH